LSKEVNLKRDGHLKEAADLIKFARKELNRAKKENNLTLARQVSEKGYLALLRVVDALLVKKGVSGDELPKGERGRRYFLGKHADKEFRKNYAILRHDLHIDGFHEGILEFKEIRESLEDLQELVREME